MFQYFVIHTQSYSFLCFFFKKIYPTFQRDALKVYTTCKWYLGDFFIRDEYLYL